VCSLNNFRKVYDITTVTVMQKIIRLIFIHFKSCYHSECWLICTACFDVKKGCLLPGRCIYVF